MKDSTVERLWNGMICFGLSVLVLLFSFFFSTLLLAAHDHSYAGMDVLAMSFFTLLTSFVMLRLAKSLKLFSFDLKFLTKKNIQIIFLGLGFVLLLSFAEIVLVNQHVIVESSSDSFASQFLSKAPPLIILPFSVIFTPIMEEVIFRGGIIVLVFKDKMLLGVIVSSLIYSLVGLSGGVFNWLLCIGTNVVLGISYAKTKRLEVPIIIKMIAVLFVALSI